MLEPILQQLGAGNPQLAQLIASNPDAFLQLLGEDAEDDVPLPPGAQAISVTEEERDAIERVRLQTFAVHSCPTSTNHPLAVPSWLRQRPGYPGLLCLRQERGARCQLSIRPARRRAATREPMKRILERVGLVYDNEKEIYYFAKKKRINLLAFVCIYLAPECRRDETRPRGQGSHEVTAGDRMTLFGL